MTPESPTIQFLKIRKPERVCYRAGWIVQSPSRIVKDGYIEVEKGRIKTVSASPPRGKAIDLGPGVIMPCLINAHLHLELSALKNALSFEHGFTAWVRELLVKREAMSPDTLRAAAKKAAAQLIPQGVGVIGEISTLGITREQFTSLDLAGVWFQEILGGVLPDYDLEKSGNLSCSLAGHAPHTTAPDVLKALKTQTLSHSHMFSIHVAESRAESEFMDTGKGQWADFLISRGIAISSWPVGNTTPVQYLCKLGLLDAKTLAVHLLRANDMDFKLISETNTRVCICPRSNYNLHRQLPDIPRMLARKISPALGTDSLASCDSLSIFDEMAFVRSHYPDIDPGTVLAMATTNGASALGLDDEFGSLDPGRRATFLYTDRYFSDTTQVLESLTHNAT